MAALPRMSLESEDILIRTKLLLPDTNNQPTYTYVTQHY